MAESDSSKKNNAYLHQMSTEELKELLNTKIAAGDEDDLLFDLLEVIDQRDAEDSNGTLANVDQAWDDFQKYYNLPEGDGKTLFEDDVEDELKPLAKEKPAPQFSKHRHSFRHLIAVIAAAAILISLLIPAVFGFDLWKIMGQWTQDFFSFTNTQKHSASSVNEPPIGATIVQEHTYATLQDALDAYGITEPLVPTWLPDGYQCITIDVTEFSLSTDFCAFYENGDRLISIAITKYQDDSYIADTVNAYEKDATDMKTYLENGNLHYIFENNHRVIVAWCVDSYSCAIKADISTEDAEKMVDSIYL